jgi:hypothetical protein
MVTGIKKIAGNLKPCAASMRENINLTNSNSKMVDANGQGSPSRALAKRPEQMGWVEGELRSLEFSTARIPNAGWRL